MKKLILTNCNVIFPDHIEKDLTIVCEGKIIKEIIPVGDTRPNENAEYIDVNGKYVSPGFIDIHTHGGGGHDFMDGTVEAYLGAAETHAKYGTTALLPTTLSGTSEEMLKTFSIYKEAVKRNKNGAKFMGLHIEGPYFSYNQRGAQDAKYLRNPEPEEYNKILNATDDIVRWSLAPELQGASDFAKVLKSKNILASIAHSDAIYEEVVEAHKAGFSLVTHLYSGMSTITRKNAYRYAGVVESAYLIDDMDVEIIADGVHLPKSLLQFVYKFKGSEKIALCTDSMRGAGMPDGESILGSLEKGQKVIIEDGVAKLRDRTAFAGSVATTDRLVRTMVNIAEVPLVEAIKMITLTPARILRIDKNKGSIKRGKDADFVIFDKNINVSYTILEGNVIHKN